MHDDNYDDFDDSEEVFDLHKCQWCNKESDWPMGWIRGLDGIKMAICKDCRNKDVDYD